MDNPYRVIARSDSLVVLTHRPSRNRHTSSGLQLVNLGSLPVFVHEGVLDLGGGTFGSSGKFLTGQTAAVLASGEMVDLLPVSVFAGVPNDQNEYDSIIRKLRHAGASPLRVRVSTANRDLEVSATVGSLADLIINKEVPIFEVFDASIAEVQDVEED